MEKKRILFVFSIFIVILCLVMGGIIYRASYFSLDNGKWAEYGERRLHTVDTIPADRGNIYDCEGHLLSSTLPQYTFYLDFGHLNKYVWKDSRKVLNISKSEADSTKMSKAFYHYLDSLALCLSKEFGDRTKEQYKQYLKKGAEKKSGYYQVTSRKATYQQMMRIKDFPYFRIGIKEVNTGGGYTVYKSNLSGLIMNVEVRRENPYGSLASRTIGRIFPDREKGGEFGLEYAYDSLLRGTPGLGRYVYARINKNPNTERTETKSLVVTIEEPVAGKDVISTVDIGMQEIAEKALREEVTELHATMGMAALMEVETGEVKAISNLTRLANGSYQEIRNEMLVGLLEPGSTFKTASMMAALEDGLVHVNDPVIPGRHGAWDFAPGATIRDHNWRRGGYETLTIPEVMYYSSNIGIATIVHRGYASNPQKYLDRLNKIGVTKPMDIELPGAEAPDINNPATKHKRNPKSRLGAWSNTTLPWMSFGYELLLPPIYTLNFYNAIANGGVMIRPIFAKEIRYNGKVEQTFETEVLNPAICSASTLETIQCMLLGVVEQGTGKPIKSDYMRIAGKTGTVQVHGTAYTNVSFCGYFPADKPKYTCFVMICNVDHNLGAGGTAGKVFKNIAEQIYVANLQMPAIAAKDTIPNRSLMPEIKKGNAVETENVLKALNISYQGSATTEWITQRQGQNNIYLDNLALSKEVVPNVVGMGAKDAVYILEKVGLRVKLSGRGKVFQQSIPAGNNIPKGQLITIQLN